MTIPIQNPNLEGQLALAEEWRAQLERWVGDMRAVRESQARLRETEASLDPTLLALLTGGGVQLAHIPEGKGEHRHQSNLDVFEAILRAEGRPTHIDTLTRLAEGKVALKGKLTTPAKTKIRNSLSGAPHKFENTGGNIWWLTGVPVPDDVLARGDGE